MAITPTVITPTVITPTVIRVADVELMLYLALALTFLGVAAQIVSRLGSTTHSSFEINQMPPIAPFTRAI